MKREIKEKKSLLENINKERETYYRTNESVDDVA